MIAYQETEINRMNRTARTAGAVGADPVVVRYLADMLQDDDTALDYGAGPSRRHANYIEVETGCVVDSYDIGSNAYVAGHVKTIRAGHYDVAYASNVLNVQPSYERMADVFRELSDAVHNAGYVVWNYPKSPRHANLSAGAMLQAAKAVFGYAQSHPAGNGLYFAMKA